MSPSPHWSCRLPLRDDDVFRATLTNGLQVIIVPNKLAPVVTTMVNYRVGSDECPAGFPGAAHATEGDPAQRETTPDTVKALTIDDVQDYYRAAFRPGLTTIVVIGKIAPGDAVAAIQKYFGNWKVEGPKPNTLFPPAPTSSISVTHVPDSSRVQDKVTLAEHFR